MNHKKLAFLIVIVTGLMYILAKFVPHKPFGQIREDFTVWFDIIAAFAFILGGSSLLIRHLSKVFKLSDGWGYSLACVIAFIVTLIAGLFKIGNPEGISGPVSSPDSMLGFIYNYFYSPLSATMFSLLAFFVASASYRAFRAKNTEATVLLISALLILLGRTFLGTLATDWLPESLSFLRIQNLFTWLMVCPNNAGQRAIMIGIALGVVSTSLKLILGIEASYLGSDEENA